MSDIKYTKHTDENGAVYKGYWQIGDTPLLQRRQDRPQLLFL